MRTIALLTMMLLVARAPADELRDAALRAAAAQAQAEAEVAVAGPPIVQALARVTEREWRADPETPTQLNLYEKHDGVWYQRGAMDATGDYYATNGKTWTPATPPTLPPTELLLKVKQPNVKSNPRPFDAGQVITDGTRATPVQIPTADNTGAASPSSTMTTAPARTATAAPRADRRGNTTTVLIPTFGVNCVGRT